MKNTPTTTGELWKGRAGGAWAEVWRLTDQMLEPFVGHLLETLPADFPGRVLDIGCGAGATTIAAAHRLPHPESCVGLDISEPMLQVARRRAQESDLPLTFLQGDAQTYAFEGQLFDRMISRFGVMFFADPVQAFRNLAGACSVGGKLRFLAWRSPEENPFMTQAQRAAQPLVPEIPQRRDGSVGQFAFADENHVRNILQGSGWAQISIKPLDLSLKIPWDDLELFVTTLGPLGLVYDGIEQSRKVKVLETVTSAFLPYRQGSELLFRAACWTVDASKEKQSS